MRRFNRWLLAAPLYVQFLVSAATFGLVTFGLDEAVSDHPEPWVLHVFGGLLYGAFMTGFFAWRRRKDGGAAQQLALATALRTGRLLEGADPDSWRMLLDDKERTLRRWRPWGIVEFAAFAGLAVVLAITQDPIWWAFAAVFVAMGIGVAVGGRRNEARIARLRAALDDERRQAV